MILHGDCRNVMATLEANSVDAIVSDPPYGLSFMGKGWDHGVPGVEFWVEALRVAKPGAHLLAFGGTRTYHRLACAIEDAGWEVRDCIAWVYGSGFPKSHNLKDDWQGWGTALKPAYEPIIVARKPLVGTVAENVITHGTGAINVDGCRVESGDNLARVNTSSATWGSYGSGPNKAALHGVSGRWPANLIHDGSDEVVGLFPQTTSGSGQVCKGGNRINPSGWVEKNRAPKMWQGDTGSAARFFYCAKASKADRDAGCEGMHEKFAPTMGNGIGAKEHDPDTATPKRNHHPTVKPTDLMRYLCRLVTPPGGTVLDPFCGSGSTGKGAILEGFNFIGIEREAEYVEIAKARTEWARKNYQPSLF